MNFHDVVGYDVLMSYRTTKKTTRHREVYAVFDKQYSYCLPDDPHGFNGPIVFRKGLRWRVGNIFDFRLIRGTLCTRRGHWGHWQEIPKDRYHLVYEEVTTVVTRREVRKRYPKA